MLIVILILLDKLKVKKRVVINKLINSLLAFLVKTVILTDKSTILEFVQNLA